MSDRMDALLKPQDVADRFQVSVKTVYRWSREGYLKPIRTHGGRTLRFRPADVEALYQDDAS